MNCISSQLLRVWFKNSNLYFSISSAKFQLVSGLELQLFTMMESWVLLKLTQVVIFSVSHMQDFSSPNKHMKDNLFGTYIVYWTIWQTVTIFQFFIMCCVLCVQYLQCSFFVHFVLSVQCAVCSVQRVQYSVCTVCSVYSVGVACPSTSPVTDTSPCL